MRGGDYDVFVSYAHSDAGAEAELNTWLRGQGLSTFFDRSELRQDLPWVPALEEAINRSRAVAILFGKHGIGNGSGLGVASKISLGSSPSNLPAATTTLRIFWSDMSSPGD